MMLLSFFRCSYTFFCSRCLTPDCATRSAASGKGARFNDSTKTVGVEADECEQLVRSPRPRRDDHVTRVAAGREALVDAVLARLQR